jgi:hypothetical protein
LQEGRENANIDAGLGFIWRISANIVNQTLFLPPVLAGFLSLGLQGYTNTSSQKEFNLQNGAPLEQNYTFAGKYLAADFTLASDSVFQLFNSDFSAAALYVDADQGSDSNPGSSSAPLKTLAAAQLAVQNILATANTNIVVVLRGSFYLPQPLQFEAADSGQGSFFVTYMSDPQNPATISGGKILTGGWTLVDSTKNMYSMNVGSLNFRNLFVNGQMAEKARSNYPLTASVISDSGQVDCSQCDLPPISSPSTVEVVAIQQWIVSRCQGVLNLDKTVTVVNPCASNMMDNVEAPTRGVAWIESSPLFVSKPGQWALDSTAGILYYIPRPNEDLSTAKIVAPQLTQLIQASGLANVAFIGLKFSQTDWQQANSNAGFVDIQADMYITKVKTPKVDYEVDWIPTAFDCEACRHVLVMDSEFSGLGASGIRFGKGSTDNLFFHNQLLNISASGIQIGEFQGTDDSSTVSNTVIEDNAIMSIGQEYFGSTAIFQIYAANSKIQHNDVHDVPYTGISVGWGWSADLSPNSHDNLIFANNIFNAMQVCQDGGGIYTLSNQPGTTTAHNYVHDISTGLPGLYYGFASNGIYLDSGSSHMILNNNVMENIPNEDLVQQTYDPLEQDNTFTSDGIDSDTIKAEAGVRQLVAIRN